MAMDAYGEYAVDVHRDLVTFLALRTGFQGLCPNLTPAIIGDESQRVDEDHRNPHNFSLGTGYTGNLEYHFPTISQLRFHRSLALNTCARRYIGNYLHALADSFSHQYGRRGRSDWRRSPRRRQIWHAIHGHEPDYTYLRPDLADLMAYHLYQALRDLAQQCCDCLGVVVPWRDIRDRVRRFNRSRERDEKQRILGIESSEN